MPHVRLNHNSWYGHAPVEFDLPDSWELSMCSMPVDSQPVLSRNELKKCIDSPLGSPSVSELAQGKKDVCIIFDDMSRGTPCGDIAEIILEELHKADIPKNHIRFICALGSHGSCTREDFEKKLNKRIVKEYAVFNHNAFQNLTHAGTTSGGVELYINSEVMACDLKIGIGMISPHPVNGFGGGGKLLAIGCAGIETISQLHRESDRILKRKQLSFVNAVGSLENDGMRCQIEEAMGILNFDFKIDTILNSNCEIVACTAGDPNAEYKAGVVLSQKLHFSENTPSEMDVVFANANVKANEAPISLALASSLLKSQGGSLVLVNHVPNGQVLHQLNGPAGYYTGGRGFHGHFDRFPKVNKLIYYTPYPDMASALTFSDGKHISFAENWNEVMAELKDYGPGTKAAVITDGTIIAFHQK